MLKSVCVYCSSSSKLSPVYYKAAERMGKLFAEAGIHLVFGGGKSGLMGTIADSLLQQGGEAIGVIPGFMCDEGWQHDGLTELKVVETMHQRKAMMAEMADAAVALPGGIGTFDELFEIITWKQLGLFTKPVVILNTNNYYRHFIELLHVAAVENFLRDEHRQIWQVVNTPEEVIPAIKNAVAWPDDARSFAAV
jgi:uncharacterized protein (TIGR00730 family)